MSLGLESIQKEGVLLEFQRLSCVSDALEWLRKVVNSANIVDK